MRVIAHRGNLFGPNPEQENHPDYLLDTISLGIEVEVDVWLVDSNFFLGHDAPEYPVNPAFIKTVAGYAWFHCKDLSSLHWFIKNAPECRFFWHQEDDFTLTSNNYIWTYPGNEVSTKSIIVDLDFTALDTYAGVAYAVCTDRAMDAMFPE